MFVVAANLLISGICDSSSWASVMASPVGLAISSSSVECKLVPLTCTSKQAPRMVVINSIADSKINFP